MQAAQLLAGYSLGRRRPAAPRDGQEDQVGDGRAARDFVEGCAAHNNITAAKANELFDLIDKFAGYGFNKSHAAAYALVAYQTAWLKAHHRAEFYAASMSFDMALTDKLGIFVEDMRRGGRRMPAARHQRQPGRSYRRGWQRSLCAGRAEGRWREGDGSAGRGTRGSGAFASLEDFAARIDPRLLNRRQLESLAGAGAFDAIKPDVRRSSPPPRPSSLMPRARMTSAPAVRPACSAQSGGSCADPPAARRVWTLPQRMAAERDAFGFYFSAHPVDARVTCSPRTR